MYKKLCSVCKKEMFRLKKSEALRKNWLFCSKHCRSVGGNKKRKLPEMNKMCLYCNKNFIVRTKRQQKYKFCSKKCGLTFLNKTEKHKQSVLKGKSCKQWKGDNVGYSGIHCWLRKKYGKPNFCKICKSTTEKKYVWANISGKYKRDIKDYVRLCDKCHKQYDDVLNRSWKTRKKKVFCKNGKSRTWRTLELF